MTRRKIEWTAEQLAWIEANSRLPRRELAERFHALWPSADVTQEHLHALCKRRRWLTGRDGRFPPGHDSGYRGGGRHPNTVATQFKKGNRTGRANHLYQPIGTERVSKSGYRERKVNDDMPLKRRWRAVHLIEWEKVNGPVPAGHCLKSLDGDRLNTDPTNWVAVPRALLPRLTGRWRAIPYDSAPDELKPILLAVARLEHAAREARRAG